jgi:hypothetical protein
MARQMKLKSTCCDAHSTVLRLHALAAHTAVQTRLRVTYLLAHVELQTAIVREHALTVYASIQSKLRRCQLLTVSRGVWTAADMGPLSRWRLPARREVVTSATCLPRRAGSAGVLHPQKTRREGLALVAAAGSRTVPAAQKKAGARGIIAQSTDLSG